MDIEKLRRLQPTPRTLTPELEKLVSPEHPLYSAGCYTVIAGVLGSLIFIGLAFFGVISWVLVGVTASIAVIGAVLMAAFRSVALRKGREELSRAPLALAAIVQANAKLNDPNSSGLGAAVLVYTTNPVHALDGPWVSELAQRIRLLKGTGSSDPALRQLVANLYDEHSYFTERLPAPLTLGIDAVCCVTTLDAVDLPGERLPQDGLIPVFVQPNGSVRALPATMWQ